MVLYVKNKKEHLKAIAKYLKDLPGVSLLTLLTPIGPYIRELVERLPESLYPLRFNDRPINPFRGWKRIELEDGTYFELVICEGVLVATEVMDNPPEIRKPRSTEEDWDLWRRMYEGLGLSIRDIAILTRWSPSTIRRSLHKRSTKME